MSLTLAQKTANEVFFTKVFSQLKPGGVWMGDAGSMKKADNAIYGKVWLAELETYEVMKRLVTSKYIKDNIVLFADLSKM
jgi:predicted methyltransferase